MKFFSASSLFILLVGSGLGAVSCKSRNYDSANLQSADQTIDPMAFNAYYMWLFGKGSAEFDYPKSYAFSGKRGDDDYEDNDYTFYDSGEDFFTLTDGKYSYDLKPDEEASVKGNLLSFQSRQGRVLTLIFRTNDKKSAQLAAAETCKSLSLRLPTVYEIANYCTAQTERDSADGTYKKNRCSGKIWSATKLRQNEGKVWVFDASEGKLVTLERSSVQDVMCVGRDS